MKNKVCCAFGHREAYGLDQGQLQVLLERLILTERVSVFMTGAMGEFDKAFIDAVCLLKKKHRGISLIWVKPSFSTSLNTDAAVYQGVFDEIIVPEESDTAHFKAAIKVRNRWMVDHSDAVVAYVYRGFGGAHDALRYAVKRQKSIFNLAEISS